MHCIALQLAFWISPLHRSAVSIVNQHSAYLWGWLSESLHCWQHVFCMLRLLAQTPISTSSRLAAYTAHDCTFHCLVPSCVESKVAWRRMSDTGLVAGRRPSLAVGSKVWQTHTALTIPLQSVTWQNDKIDVCLCQNSTMCCTHGLAFRYQSVFFYPLHTACLFCFNPFAAPACKISGLKMAHIHACKQYIWWSCNKSTFNTVHFGRNPLTCSWDEGGKALMVSNLALLLVVFRVMARHAWQWKG